MPTLDALSFNNTFATLPSDFFTRQPPTSISNPAFVSVNTCLANTLELSQFDSSSKTALDYLSGRTLPPGSSALAMVYAGHQFGHYVPQLGDGRGLLVGQIKTSDNENWDLHLKGAGQTPYSRNGDGRAVLRSSIREYLGSEALHALGVPSSRALAIVTSDTPVVRETMETAATLLRVCKTHIRFGHFEYFHYRDQTDAVKVLTEHAIEYIYPECAELSNPYEALLQVIVSATAKMIAHWQAVGFCHGVMNTDNMVITGETFDFGPYAFMNQFDPTVISNSSDYSGRYAFQHQPSIGLWNLNALANALSSLIDEKTIESALSNYEVVLNKHYLTLMKQKLGLQGDNSDDLQLIGELLQLLYNFRIDYSLFFHQLCEMPADEIVTTQGKHNATEQFRAWHTKYLQRQDKEQCDQRQSLMQRSNPKFIMRNYMMENAIRKAVDDCDYSEVDSLLTIAQNPFDNHPDWQHYAQQPPEWASQISLSCSS